MTRTIRKLETKPSNHFGEAYKRLQSLFLMFRENSDVFDIFCKNAYRIRCHPNGTFAETILNYMFSDLTSCHSNQRVAIVIKELI
jgi:hypothetical protein